MNPSYIEDNISQIPALQLLLKQGFAFIDPEEAMQLRDNHKYFITIQ